jgi:hypothetical protein
VNIDWLSGYRCHVETKPGFWGPGDDEFAKVYIGNKDLGWYQWAVQRTPGLGSLAGGLAGQGFWAVIGTPNPYKLGFTSVTTGFLTGLNIGDQALSPIVVVPRSTFLVDFGNNSMSVYTIEGHVTLVNANRQSVNVSTGQKVVVSDLGSYSSVTGFEETELSGEQRAAVLEMPGESDRQARDTASNTNRGPLSLCPCASLLATATLVTAIVMYRRR